MITLLVRGLQTSLVYRGMFVAGKFDGNGVYQSAQFYVQGTFKAGLLHGRNVRQVKVRNNAQEWVVDTSGTYDMGKVSDEILVPLGGKASWEIKNSKPCHEGMPYVGHYLRLLDRAHCRACGEWLFFSVTRQLCVIEFTSCRPLRVQKAYPQRCTYAGFC